MPPRKKQPRCAYVEGRRRCARPGSGDPPLCAVHEMLLEEDPPPVTLDDVLDDLFGRAEDLVRRTTNKLKRDLREVAAQPPRVIYQRVREAPRARPRPAPPPPTKAPEIDAREILGFPPGIKLTRDAVKTRQRELAKIFHPDRQGSTAAMQRVNAAAKQLLENL